MLLTHPPQIDSIEAPARRRGSFALAARSGLYILLVLATALSAGGYGLRKYGIFGCSRFWIRFRRVSRLLRHDELW